jgi:hypothetical protein
MERWKPTRDDRYEVSSLGRVRRVKRGQGVKKLGVLKPNADRGGYLWLRIGQKHSLVHALVASAFIGPRPEGLEIDHIDGDKKNNAVSNLEYVTPAENKRRAVTLGLIRGPRSERAGRAKLDWSDVHKIRKLHSEGWTAVALATKFGVTGANIGYIIHNQTWIEEESD